jgi:hypothetical protein
MLQDEEQYQLCQEKKKKKNGEMQVCHFRSTCKSKVTRLVVGHGSELFISWRTSRHDGEMLVIATSNL